MCLVGAIVGFAVCALTGPDKSDYRGAIENAQRLETLSRQLGDALEAERSARAEIEEGFVAVESNLRAATARALEFEIRYSEIAIRNRAVESALAGLGIELSDIGIDISAISDDIGDFIDSATNVAQPQAP